MPRQAQSLPKLTRKQHEVLALVADNRTSKEIAARLGITESAVNQRIEMVRSRLGGLPRGELARLYRQEHLEPASEPRPANETWQKIHLPESFAIDEDSAAESISLPQSNGSRRVAAEAGDGSQLSAFFFQGEAEWLAGDNRPRALL
ncbi:MAG: helix-turn-helix transcriptional regulator, partial [Sphingomonadaceae bacterium]|nr:helix-turn-helix transcriptional regulator [Sphingomonadaceae bacterium]